MSRSSKFFTSFALEANSRSLSVIFRRLVSLDRWGGVPFSLAKTVLMEKRLEKLWTRSRLSGGRRLSSIPKKLWCTELGSWGSVCSSSLLRAGSEVQGPSDDKPRKDAPIWWNGIRRESSAGWSRRLAHTTELRLRHVKLLLETSDNFSTWRNRGLYRWWKRSKKWSLTVKSLQSKNSGIWSRLHICWENIVGICKGMVCCKWRNRGMIWFLTWSKDAKTVINTIQ